MVKTPRMFGGWFEKFIQEKRMGQHRRGIVVKETSLAAYGYRYQVLLTHGLNLEICTLDQVRTFLGDYQKTHKPLTYINQVAFVKEAAKFLGRDFHDSLIIPKRPDPAERVKDQLIEEDKIKKLIDKAPTLRDRCLLLILFESGVDGESSQTYVSKTSSLMRCQVRQPTSSH